MRPNSGMKRPRTPASFMSRRTISGSLRDVRISKKQPIGFGIGAKLRVDQLESPRDKSRRVGMDRQTIAVGDPKKPDEIDRIARQTHPDL